jgi:hypothetical protein
MNPTRTVANTADGGRERWVGVPNLGQTVHSSVMPTSAQPVISDTRSGRKRTTVPVDPGQVRAGRRRWQLFSCRVGGHDDRSRWRG